MRVRLVDHAVRIWGLARQDWARHRRFTHRRGGIHVRADLRHAGQSRLPYVLDILKYPITTLLMSNLLTFTRRVW